MSNTYKIKVIKSDTGEVVKTLEADTEQRKARSEKRKANKEYNLAFLKRKDIPFVDMNNGVHVRLVFDGETIDFYPSTGLYILKDGTKGRGIFSLWKLVKDKL